MTDEQTPAAGPSLLPCPFCGGRGHTCTASGLWTVDCRECLAEGSPRGDKEAAIAAWNRRPHVASPASSSSVVQGDASGVEDLAGKLTAIRDKFLIPTPDKDFTDYAIITRSIAALRLQPSGETREAVARIVDQIEVVTGAHGPRIRPGEKARVTNAILSLLCPAAPDAGGWDDPVQIAVEALKRGIKRCETYEHIRLGGRSEAAKKAGTLRNTLTDMRQALSSLQPGGER